MCSYMEHTIATLTRSCRFIVRSRKASNKTLSACINRQKTKLSVRGAELHAPGGPWNCTMRALEEEVCIWIVSVVGDLYHKKYTNVREIKRLEGNFI